MSDRGFLCGLLLTLTASFGSAQTVDMNDPRRAVGLEDDVRVDAQLLQETVSAGSPIGVKCVVENRTSAAIALSQTFSANYDASSRTITLSVGTEVPLHGAMPRMVIIAPGEKKGFTGGALLQVPAAGLGGRFSTAPRSVQIDVNVLRDVVPFRALIVQSSNSSQPVALTDALFDKWLESNDTIALNAVPVRYDGFQGRSRFMPDASQAGMDARANLSSSHP
jgi:hypothetical protein